LPTYQYACTECGEQLEAVQKFTDDPLTVCPVCQGKLRKLFSSVGIVFKGSGFYRTDSRSSSSEAAVPAGDSGKGESDKSESGKSEKPAAAASSDSSSSSTPAANPAAASTPAPSSGSSGSSAPASTPKAAAS
jgi:putative FmdB family regulatory protein